MIEPSDWVGKSVESIWIDRTRQYLCFVFADGAKAALATFADCCSYTWFEHVENLGFKGTITSIEQSTSDDHPQMEGRDYVQVYFVIMKTERGRLLIDFRNDSNGYYGGDVFIAGAPEVGAANHGGVVATNDLGWTEIPP